VSKPVGSYRQRFPQMSLAFFAHTPAFVCPEVASEGYVRGETMDEIRERLGCPECEVAEDCDGPRRLWEDY
jgi:hypothetical protein